MARVKIELRAESKATTALELSPGATRQPIGAIRLRKNVDTRPLSAIHVVTLMESIATLGLLEPIIVDTKGQLLAGGHRLAALQFLAIDDTGLQAKEFARRAGHTGDELPTKGDLKTLLDRVAAIDATHFLRENEAAEIPIHVIALPGESQDRVSLAVEAAENNVRRQYTNDEILSLAERFKAAGYVEAKGRPKANQKTVMSALEAALGRSKRHIQRLIKPDRNGNKRTKTEWAKAVAALKRAAERVMEAGAKKEGEAEKSLVAAAERSLKAVGKVENG